MRQRSAGTSIRGTRLQFSGNMAKQLKHVDFSEIYATPKWHQPPEGTKLDGCTNYPNLNSINFRQSAPSKDAAEDFYEVLETNEAESTFILAANSYTGRLWDSSLYFYDRAEDVGSSEKCALRSKLNATVSNIRFIDEKMFLLTDYTGSIQMWSTQSAMRSESGYSLYNIATKTEATSVMNAIDVVAGENGRRVVTVSSDCSIRIWNIGAVDLVSERIYRYAHSDAIEDVSGNPNDGSLFCTCSYDKSFSIWDERITKPAIGCHESHSVAYTACKWLPNNHVYVGDESGNLHLFDIKNIKTPVESTNVFDRPIYRIRLKNNLLGLIGQTNRFKVFDVSDNETNLVYENADADDFVRDICWVKKKEIRKQFYTVGYNKHIRLHAIN